MKIKKSNQIQHPSKTFDVLSSYARLSRIHQPIGILLLFLPCLFGIFLSLKKLPNPEPLEIIKIILLFLAGSIIMRSAGCIINDLFDYKFDQKVTRTKNRPIASGKITHIQALIFLALLLLGGLFILLQLNQAAIFSGFFVLTLVISYPLMKRITYYPQFFLGLAFNFGIIMSGLAIIGKIDADFFILYFSAIIWTIIYDTIYAYQDIEDDLKIGVKSSAIKFAKNPKKILIILSLIMSLNLVLLGIRGNFYSGFFLLILFASLLSSLLIKKCNFNSSASCLKAFKANFWVGILILIAIILG